MLGTEAIPMARRVFHRLATVRELARRVGLEEGAAAADDDEGASFPGASARGGPSSDVEAARRQAAEVARLRGLVDGLCAENAELWAVVDELRTTVAGLVQDRPLDSARDWDGLPLSRERPRGRSGAGRQPPVFVLL